MFGFLMSSSTTLIHVYFGLPARLLPHTSCCNDLLSMLFSSLRFTWWNHLNLIFLNPCSRFSTPHLLLTSSLVILPCHLTLHMYLNNSWLQLTDLPVFLLVPKFPQHTAMQASHTHSKPLLFPLVECNGLLASLPIPFIYSKHQISYPLLPILPLLHIKSHHQDNKSCPLFPDYLLPKFC